MNNYILSKTVLLLSMLIVSGLGVSQKRLLDIIGDKKHSLKGKTVTQLKVSHVNDGVGITLGSSIGLVVQATLDDGKELTTIGSGKGKTKWDNYNVSVDGGNFTEGVITVNTDASAITNHQVSVKVVNAHDESISAEYSISLDYLGDLFYCYCGQNGANGNWGRNGRNGESNSSWQTGGAGSIGSDGGDGGNGGNGQYLSVAVKSVNDKTLGKDLLHLKVSSAYGEDMYIVDPNSKITISAAGGNGGKGGNGGNGGYGGVGVNGGDGGNGGVGGNGGNGGDGGRITLILDPSAEKYASSVVCLTNGGYAGGVGSGGAGGSGGGSSGGSNGKSGKSGKSGAYSGNPGENGPEPIIRVEQVDF